MAHQISLGPKKALAKLERRGTFSAEARDAFLRLDYRTRVYDSQQEIVRQGDQTDRCRFLESGTVSRSKLLPNGNRQIVAFHIAGDVIDLQSALLILADHTLRAHECSVVVSVCDVQILRLAQDHPEIGRAFWFDTLVDGAIFQEWSLNLGRRNGRERTAHLLMEMGYRSESAGLDCRCDFSLPITQVDMADALGLTPVHLNRSMQWLRSAGYIGTARRRLIIHDWDAMAELAHFRPLYLHPEGPRRLQ